MNRLVVGLVYVISQYFLELSKDLQYISVIEYETLINLSIEVAKMLNSLLTKIKSCNY